MFLSFNFFPFCLKPFGFLVGRTVFRAVISADNRGDKASVRSESATEYPNFGRMRKFVEGCRQALRPKAKRHLTFLLSAVPLHGKMVPDQEEQNEQSTIAKDFRKERNNRFQIRLHKTKSVILLLQV